MKKVLFSALSMFFLATALVSCAGGMSDEEIAKKAEEKLKSEEATLLEEATAACDKVVATKLDSIRNVKAEEAAKAEEEAAKDKKKGK